MKKVAYLTIDDAPSEDFRNKVDYLSTKKIPAIFFCLGQYIEFRQKDIVYAIKKGFVIGSHSYNHLHFSELSLKEAEKQIKKTDILINKCYKKANVKRKFKVFRFPYLDKGGRKKKSIQKVLKRQGYEQLNFDNITYDWFRKDGYDNDIDVYCSYDTMDWTITDKSYEFGIHNLKGLLNRMSENYPEGHRGLNYRESADIIMMHDHAEIAGLFKPMIEKLIRKGIVFKLPLTRR